MADPDIALEPLAVSLRYARRYLLRDGRAITARRADKEFSFHKGVQFPNSSLGALFE